MKKYQEEEKKKGFINFKFLIKTQKENLNLII